MKDALQACNIHLQPDEFVRAVVRKHWFVNFSESIGILAVGALPFVAVPFIAPYLTIHPAAAGFVTSVWLLLIWIILFTIWTNYYLDVWIVTDKRIVNVNQVRLFKRDTSTLRIERVQDIKVETHGIFATLLRFGNLQVQTAGPEASFYLIEGISRPSDVRNMILAYVDIATEHKSRFEYNLEQRPTQSE